MKLAEALVIIPDLLTVTNPQFRPCTETKNISIGRLSNFQTHPYSCISIDIDMM